MNNHNELPADEQYPDEHSLSETYRVLEGFAAPPGSTGLSYQPLTAVCV